MTTKTKPMTLRQAQDTVRSLGPGFLLRWSYELGEYRLYTPNCNGSAYYTSDREDAVNTALYVARAMQGGEPNA